MSEKVKFTKMHGAGNDYIYVNSMEYDIVDPAETSRKWSDRHKGIGGDGLVLIGKAKSENADYSMRIFNADGSEAMMCGNASRCIGKYLYEKGITRKKDIRLETLSGIKILHLNTTADDTVGSVTVDMLAPSLREPRQCAIGDGGCTDGKITVDGGESFTGTFVSMGNPHFVIFVRDISSIDIYKLGPLLERHKAFPERCNIEFAEVKSDGTLRVRVWERGSGVTMACGTGACATAVAAALTHRNGRESTIEMDGGILSIRWNEADNHVYMTGPAAFVFEGEAEQ